MAISVLLGTCLLIVATAVMVLTHWRPSYDDATHQLLARQVTDIAERWSKGDFSRNEIDLATLNNGNWTIACVYGGYNNPLDEMAARGATISPQNRARLAELGSRDFRLSQVEELEAMVAYIDRTREAHFIHLESGFGRMGQHLKQCTTSDRPKIELS